MFEDRLTPSASFRFVAPNDVTTPAQYATTTNWFKLEGDSTLNYPVDGDSVYFQPLATGAFIEGMPVYVSQNCVIPQAYDFGGLHLQGGYEATVSVQDNTSTDFLELRSGAIAQLGTSSDLFVTAASTSPAACSIARRTRASSTSLELPRPAPQPLSGAGSSPHSRSAPPCRSKAPATTSPP